MLSSQFPNISIQRLQAGSAPPDGIDSASKVGEGSMMWTLLDRNPQGRDGSPDIRQIWVEAIRMRVLGIFGLLDTDIV